MNQDIIITKPIGNGLIMTASKNLSVKKTMYNQAISYMLELNKSASEVASSMGIKACTDITGYGLIGHLKNLLKASKVSAKIKFSEIPLINRVADISIEKNWSSGAKNNEKYLNKNILWDKEINFSQKMILFDPQTSGGLLFTVEKSKSTEFQKKLSKNKKLYVKKIGETVKKSNFEIKFF